MKKLKCFFGFHAWEGKNKPAYDGGELFWETCKECGKETQKNCIHHFGPVNFIIKQ